MKHVSFSVAKALKEAGYQQGCDYTYDLETKTLSVGFISQNRFEAPTYLEAWLWLWREKKIVIDLNYDDVLTGKWESVPYDLELIAADDPEEAIIEAIEYLVENKLLK